MRTARCILVLSLMLSVFAKVGFSAELETYSKPARTAAEHWLALIDSGKYDESWKESAEIFRTHVSKDAWNASIGKVRASAGKLLSRSIKSEQFTSTVPGAPKGKYLILQYYCSFKNKEDATETITPMLDKDGQWRVAGYYVR